MALQHTIVVDTWSTEADFSSSATTCGSESTNVALAASRERASKPSAPVPAYKSRTRAPEISGLSQLNSDSLTRLGVGRRPLAFATTSFRRFHLPPIMRTVLRLFDGTKG